VFHNFEEMGTFPVYMEIKIETSVNLSVHSVFVVYKYTVDQMALPY